MVTIRTSFNFRTARTSGTRRASQRSRSITNTAQCGEWKRLTRCSCTRRERATRASMT
ncbi:hypothetical protein MAR_010727 [Mya arenaria]|uniref:Uncharacterized protein n=1 Tax=Mya arenaria TaxID=6604 RepID=A0ABY7FS17_MYAAR|nr:hypothetical protein MAR_010727 [Mya arenaria]